MNRIGIERKWIELELNWNILNPIWIGIKLDWKMPNPTWIGIELNWNKLIDPSPVIKTSCPRKWQWPVVLHLWRWLTPLLLNAAAAEESDLWAWRCVTSAQNISMQNTGGTSAPAVPLAPHANGPWTSIFSPRATKKAKGKGITEVYHPNSGAAPAICFSDRRNDGSADLYVLPPEVAEYLRKKEEPKAPVPTSSNTRSLDSDSEI